MFRKDPLERADALVGDVYAYVAYRVGNREDAEDITSAVFERAVRYRSTYDPAKGSPIAWLVGIARTLVAQAHARGRTQEQLGDVAASGDIEEEVVRRVDLSTAISGLDERSRNLIALRYGAGLSSKEIGELEDMEPNAVDVALHRVRGRLQATLASPGEGRSHTSSPEDDG